MSEERCSEHYRAPGNRRQLYHGMGIIKKKNKKVVVNNQIAELFNYPSIPRDFGKGLRDLINTFSKNIRCLKALQQPGLLLL